MVMMAARSYIMPEAMARAVPRISWTTKKVCKIQGFLKDTTLLKSSTDDDLGGGHGHLLIKNNTRIHVMSSDISSPSFAVEFLDAWDDEYGGIVIDPSSLPSSANAFASALRASLTNWKMKGKKGIWLKILSEQADLIPIAIQVDTIFLKLVAFRHAHLVAFEKSDLLFVCMLKPLSCEITVDEKELQAAKWMPIDEYIGQPFYEEDQMSRRVIEASIAAYEGHYNGFAACQLTSKLDGKLSYLYYDCSSSF
ncbi:hypothetical protein GH714_038973 [Hevea brasiliensis]|uniref:Pre-nudix hydrolase domain-containing protein n=1 Tax=Hevea brasiliensis TaxID=3981 RepID=A0A6A6KAM4_HEVBR|nr:hypothetical protein GH714_038973 [Hevea brasiliensis]